LKIRMHRVLNPSLFFGYAELNMPSCRSRASGTIVLAILCTTNSLADDPVCEASTLVSRGGPLPRNPHTLAIGWTGYSNFELVYSGKVILLDAYFDRGSAYPPLGFKASDIRKADVILIGHAHFDHMSDAASVATRTGSPVIGAPITTDQLRSQGLDPALIKTVNGKGGELLKFSGFEIEPILARHGEPPPNVTTAFNRALKSVTTPFTPEQTAELAKIRDRGSSDPRITSEGTIAYLITFEDGFRVMYRDSGGEITGDEKVVMKRIERVDVALAAVAADLLPSLTVKRALEYLKTYRPALYIPAHHDADFNGLWRSTEPIFQALKDEAPSLITLSKQYREPVCLDTNNNIQHHAKVRFVH
jgi:L-ascorbate metabolism protein UlaG (beta-lactamase superfamily)